MRLERFKYIVYIVYNMVKEYKSLRVGRQTHAALDMLRNKDETFDDVITKLLTVSDIFDHHQSVQTLRVVK